MAPHSIELPIFQPHAVSYRTPVSTEVASAWVRGETARRLMVVLRAPGCAYGLRPQGGCSYCGFRHLTTQGVRVSTGEYVSQIDAALGKRHFHQDQIREIDIYNSGSFLNDAEVPPEARSAILRRCAEEDAIRVVVVESRPEDITTGRLKALHDALDGRREPMAIEVAIGLEVYDDSLRMQGLRKGFTRSVFEAAVQRLSETATDLLGYVMLKPVEMSDEVALSDAEQAAEYVYSVAARYGVRARIALEPTFVVPHTPLAEEHLLGCYSPPSLWLVRDTAARIARLGPLTVGLWDEALQPLAAPSSCAACSEPLLAALQRFNLSQDQAALFVPRCDCARSI